MHNVLKNLYEEIQTLKSLNEKLRKRAFITWAAPKLQFENTNAKLDQLYLLALDGLQTQSLKSLKNWVTKRLIYLQEQKKNSLKRRVILKSTIREFTDSKRRLKQLILRSADLDRLSQAQPAPPPNTPSGSETLSIAYLEESQTEWPLLSGIDLLKKRHAESVKFVPLTFSEASQIAYADSLPFQSLVVNSRDLTTELLTLLEVFKHRGTQLILDESVPHKAFYDSTILDRMVTSELYRIFDTLFTSAYYKPYSPDERRGLKAYYIPPAFPFPAKPPHEERRSLNFTIFADSLEGIRESIQTCSSLSDKDTTSKVIILRHTSHDSIWEAIQKEYSQQEYLSFAEDFCSYLAQVQPHEVQVILGNEQNPELRANVAALTHLLLSQGVTPLLPYTTRVGFSHPNPEAFYPQGELESYLKQWISNRELQDRVVEFWDRYGKTLHDPWLARHRAQLSFQIIYLEERRPEIAQLTQLSSMAWHAVKPVTSACEQLVVINKEDCVPKISVIISNYNYSQYIGETLDALVQQTFQEIEIIIVDDRSTDQSIEFLRNWIQKNHARFASISLLINQQNQGPTITRNNAILHANSPFFFIQDADNPIRPDCLKKLYQHLEPSDSAFSYPTLEKFECSTGYLSNAPWNGLKLGQANYIDAMALVRQSAYSLVGGFHENRKGWEDYDLWCRIAELGFTGLWVPEVLAGYRVHSSSLLHRFTTLEKNMRDIEQQMQADHPWMSLQ